jgi:hypothetical protein
LKLLHVAFRESLANASLWLNQLKARQVRITTFFKALSIFSPRDFHMGVAACIHDGSRPLLSGNRFLYEAE